MELDFSGTVDRKFEDVSLPQSKGPQTIIKTPSKVNKVLLLFPPAYTFKSSSYWEGRF